MEGLVLGIDLGTTSLKASLWCPRTEEVVASRTRVTNAHLHRHHQGNKDEQDVKRIVAALQICVSELGETNLRRVTALGVCGQMHGMMMWKSSDSWHVQNGLYKPINVSALITWQDQRCDREFIASLPRARQPLSTGFGCVSLLWLHKHAPDQLQQYNCSGTIADYVTAMLCDLDRPSMSVQNAASWGYYDLKQKQWQMQLLESTGFDTSLLPNVVEPGTRVGSLKDRWYGIPCGTPIYVGLGDMQCSVRCVMEQPSDAVVNISTSAQVSALAPPNFSLDQAGDHPGLQYFPYFNNRFLAVAASLNGGNVLAEFVRTLQLWTHELGQGVPQAAIWEKLSQAESRVEETTQLPSISPLLHGERHLTDSPGVCVSGITNEAALSLGVVFRALCQGLAANLQTMIDTKYLIDLGVTQLVGTGSALNRSQALQAALSHSYSPLPLTIRSGDASLGCAKVIAEYLTV